MLEASAPTDSAALRSDFIATVEELRRLSAILGIKRIHIWTLQGTIIQTSDGLQNKLSPFYQTAAEALADIDAQRAIDASLTSAGYGTELRKES